MGCTFPKTVTGNSSTGQTVTETLPLKNYWGFKELTAEKDVVVLGFEPMVGIYRRHRMGIIRGGDPAKPFVPH